MKLNQTAIITIQELVSLGVELAVSSVVDIEFTRLKVKESVAVDRVMLSYQDNTSLHIIAKHLLRENIFDAVGDAIPLSLRYEAATYEFLTSVRERFDHFPTAYRLLPGLLILEDLGTSPIDFPDERSAQCAALALLAKMHAATLGKRPAYEAILEQRKLPRDPEQQRLAYQRLSPNFVVGLKLLHAYAGKRQFVGDDWEQPVRFGWQLLNERNQTLDCLIHDDLVSLRQCAMRDGQLYLFDFEHSRFGHPFLDVLRMFIGKVEYNAASRLWYRKAYAPVEGVFRHYRQVFEEHFAPLADDIWERHFIAIALAMGVALLGTFAQIVALQTSLDIKPAELVSDTLAATLLTMRQFAERRPDASAFARLCGDAIENISLLLELFLEQVRVVGQVGR